MSADTLTTLGAALTQTFAPKLERQWNRSAYLASSIEMTAGNGKNAAWEVAFPAGTAETVAEGADVSSYDADVNTTASLVWAHYRHNFQVSETLIDAAATSVGVATALEDIFGERIMNGGEILASAINYDLINGTGTDGVDPTLYGLVGGGALDATGTYATIARGTYSQWAGNVLSNGSVARALTRDLLAQADQNIFTTAGDVWDEVWCSPGVYRKYEGLFTPIEKLDIAGGNSAYTAGATSLFYKGRPVRRDKDIPTGTMIFVTKNRIKAKFLPRVGTPVDSVNQRMMMPEGGNGDEIKTLVKAPVRIAILGKTGDNVKVSMKTTIQVCVTRPNAFCLIKDISET